MGFSKQCTKCGKVKWWYQFYADKTKGFSRGIRCKECQKKKSRKWRLENPEKVKEQCRKWRLENPEKVKEQYRKYCLESPEKVKEKDRKWRQNNKMEVSLRKKYHFSIPEARKLLNAKLTDVLEFTIPQQTEVRS